MKKKVIAIFKKIFITALAVSLFLVLFLNVSTLRSTNEIKSGKSVTRGYYCVIIGSGSMSPTVLVNDLLFIKGGGPYNAGDIITYVSSSGSLVTHRIIEVTGAGYIGYITQGDANNIPDEEISGQQILGRLVNVVPGVGGLIDAIISPTGIILLASICVSLWLLRRTRGDQNEENVNFDSDPEG